jgi:hypothetical protein
VNTQTYSVLAKGAIENICRRRREEKEDVDIDTMMFQYIESILVFILYQSEK